MFENAISLKFAEGTITVETASQALVCLAEKFPQRKGPSYRRAVAARQAFLSGAEPMMGAQSKFIVAAMEAGIPFEISENRVSRLREISIATEESLRAALLGSDDSSEPN